jgi:hypothetical protein
MYWKFPFLVICFVKYQISLSLGDKEVTQLPTWLPVHELDRDSGQLLMMVCVHYCVHSVLWEPKS